MDDAFDVVAGARGSHDGGVRRALTRWRRCLRSRAPSRSWGTALSRRSSWRACKEVLDAAITIAKNNSLHRNTLAWGTIEPKVRALAAGAETSADVYPAVRYLLAQLGDNHSF